MLKVKGLCFFPMNAVFGSPIVLTQSSSMCDLSLSTHALVLVLKQKGVFVVFTDSLSILVPRVLLCFRGVLFYFLLSGIGILFPRHQGSVP